MSKDSKIVRSFLLHTVLFAFALTALSAVTLWFMNFKEIAFSVAVGGITSIASFAVLATAVNMAFVGNRSKRTLWSVLGIVKLFAIGLFLWWVVSKEKVEPVAFLGGFSTVVVGLLIENANVGSKKNKK